MKNVLYVACMLCIAFLGIYCGGSEELEKSQVSGKDSILANDDYKQWDVAPKPILPLNPEYPLAAQQDKLEGMVYAKVWITVEGKVKDPTVVKSDYPIFNQPALAAARGWTFIPAQRNHQPIEVHTIIPFRFKLR